MLLKVATLEKIRSGEIDLVFRTWKKPRVKQGTELHTAVGLVKVTSIEEAAVISDEDVRRSGFDSREDLESDREGTRYRIGVQFAGEDPRVVLRNSTDLSDNEVRVLGKRLTKMGSWTWECLELIRDHPGVVSHTLAQELEMDRDRFKRDVRKLRNLGLTESLEVGYRISPRGAFVLERKVKERGLETWT